MVRAPTLDRNGLKKGAWSEEEDNKLRAYVERYGHWNWRQLPKFAGLARCGKSCRLRWMNYLRPGVKRGNYSPEEEELLLRLHEQFGNKWSVIASYFPGRTDNEIKNHWHSHWSKSMKKVSRSMNSTDLNTMGRFHHMDASDHYEESSSITILDSSSMTTFDSIQRTDYNNIAAVDHAYSELSSLSYDSTFFDAELDWSTEDSMNLVEPIMEPFGETFWSQPFVLDTSFNDNLPQQLPPPLENEMTCPFSPYLDETDIDCLHESLQ